MIPEVNQSGVLPPFIAKLGLTNPASMAPYRASIAEFVSRYSTSPERETILRGLLAYRAKLRKVGISDGFQWLDGSFVENVEVNQNRAPNDLDIVTFADRPTEVIEQERWRYFVTTENRDIFYPHTAKEIYKCDAFFVDLSIPPTDIVQYTKYWFGLFSHQRESYLWKGMVEIPLACDDDLALAMLESGVENA